MHMNEPEVVCQKCEAVYCDGSCKGPYVWWFGVKFVVTPEINAAMREYHYELFAPTQIGKAWRLARAPWYTWR